jgi:hypothetical protein
MTDTERGLTGRLEGLSKLAAWYAEDGEDDLVAINIREHRLFIALALAADRRRQARIAGHACNGAECRDHYVTVGIQAEDDEDAALDALLAHLAGEGA